ncbi:hypothetical protein LOAG_05938 [Loa loa]|uniref:Uncharacterized protein n=1 Tax=Loa loa TaxID=7209 RepID=A0A1S0TYY1_LOALO|nr:hypothetical protein LOAG_05938 [Loa loa]EFO22543.1 hypothetical protein LOAG_05938 [Loa loa]
MDGAYRDICDGYVGVTARIFQKYVVPVYKSFLPCFPENKRGLMFLLPLKKNSRDVLFSGNTEWTRGFALAFPAATPSSEEAGNRQRRVEWTRGLIQGLAQLQKTPALVLIVAAARPN